MRPAAEGTFRLSFEGEGHHASNCYSLIPATEFQIPSVFLTRGGQQTGGPFLDPFQDNGRSQTREGRGVAHARIAICPRGWVGAILQEGMGVYQAELPSKGNGFRRMLKTAVFKKQGGKVLETETGRQEHSSAGK